MFTHKLQMKISLIKIIFTLVLFLSPFAVFAGAEHNMSGYAWSSNIGWISFNNTNGSGNVNYGVHKAPDGRLCGNDTCSVPAGYAWSPNIGWIQFGGLSGFPTGDGTQTINAKINGNNLQGWAKALSADGNGWDGWISLSGSGYGVNFDSSTGRFSGYAWGSDVVGWVSFDAAGANGVIIAPVAVPVVAVFASATSGTVNIVNPSLTWSATNSPTSCTASGDWSGTKPVSGTNVPQGVLTTVKTYTYTLTCSNTSGASASANAIVVVSAASVCFNGANNPPACTTTGGNGTCPPNYTGTYPNCTGPVGGSCSIGFTGTYPNCGGLPDDPIVCINGATNPPVCTSFSSQKRPVHEED